MHRSVAFVEGQSRATPVAASAPTRSAPSWLRPIAPTIVGGAGVVEVRGRPPRWWRTTSPVLRTPTMQTIRHTPLVLAAAGVLALTACTGDDTTDPAGSTDTETVTATETETVTTSPGATDTTTPRPTDTSTSTEAGVPAMSGTCELDATDAPGVDAITYAVPDGWQVEEGTCEFLDPELDELAQGTEPDAAIHIDVTDADFRDVSSTESIDGEIRWTGARSGYQAVRIRGGAAGQGIRPEGEAVQLVLVDLDPGTDERGGTLVMSAGPSSGAGFDLAAQALDRIAQTVRITPNATDAMPIVVTRAEGGGTPFAVTYDTVEGCFRLHAGSPSDDVVDESCDVSFGGDEIAGTILTSGDQQVVAGLAPALAAVVESDAASAPYGGITTPTEGGSLFAYDAIRTPLDVRADDAAGNELASATIG